ncbi:uncharacterized protein LOC114303318 isoform X2 [Camellia sinensis]|nr:uncharacterized protein LOC114303318 isoform X2 [Camellia sinensis]XP_028104265.1 uncharacterized protein LOC114303318 isoform X2 [Camellia sinensis]XP_028104266.1 uncharacterized protein LOC114303318 isoform X2 [Camellia sinensis]
MSWLNCDLYTCRRWIRVFMTGFFFGDAFFWGGLLIWSAMFNICCSLSGQISGVELDSKSNSEGELSLASPSSELELVSNSASDKA